MSRLFQPIQLGGIELPNRIVVAPMCQYSASDGTMQDWHLAHSLSFACSGAGLFIVEATGVNREARISHGCVGLYSDDNEAAMKRVVDAYRRVTKNPIGVQLAHAGRKASTGPNWAGGLPLKDGQSPWPTVSASAIPFAEGWHTPVALSEAGIQRLCEDFVQAAQRAQRAGMDAVELHASHGYLMHQFMSPLSNQRTDRYGGSLENRLRAPMQVAEALRAAWPKERCLGARISASDWAEGGATPEEAVVFAQRLKAVGYDYVCVSSGGLVPHARIKVGPHYQVPFAEQVKRQSGIATRAVGMIVDPLEAEKVVASGQADMVALARGFLDNPRWVWHAAEKLGVKIDYPLQYARSRADAWPGAKLARPG